MADFTLQLFHAADQEGNITALDDAPRFSAVLNALKNQDIDGDGVAGFANTLILSSGDAYIPGVFFNASAGAFGGAGRGDISIQNALGFQAIAFGNHEFDQGTALVADLIGGSEDDPTTDVDESFAGTTFPYLSSNLDFSTDANLADLVVPDAAAPQPNGIAASTVIEVNGERIGVVGATTPTISNVNVRISSPGTVTVLPQPFDSSPTPDQLDALAAEIQADVDALLAANPDIDKVVLLAHMQQIAIEQELAQRLSNVDIIVAGGSNTRLFDADDRPRAGDTNQGIYPIIQTGADGNPVAVVNTDGNYKYVGRLVIDFDENGVLLPESYDPTISGAYATDDEGVAAVGGTGLADPAIAAITAALREAVIATESNVFGVSEVFLNGNRGAVRTQETNLGNLTADANLAIAKEIDPTAVISLKNGGGIRNNIGQTLVPAGGTGEAELLPNEAIPGVKPAGGISQNDIANALSFNNALSLITVTAEELLALVEHGVSASSLDDSVSPGQFPQIGGFSFSFDATAEPGNRVQSLAIEAEDGTDIDVVVQNGAIVGDPSRTFRMVTLSFLADGGDGYPFPTGAATNRLDLVDETAPATGNATFAPNFSEQDALAEYLFDNFDTDTPFTAAETGRELDSRIQNLAFRSDGVIDALGPVNPTDPTDPTEPGVDPASLLAPLGTYETEVFDTSAAEIVVYDPATRRLFVVNAQVPAVEVLDISDPSNPTKLFDIDPSAYGAGANSVAISNGIVAVAIESTEKTDPGSVVFFDIDGNFLNAVTVGALPDMLTFTPDGTKVLVANEGEPNADYSIDPEGSISIIDLSGGVENLTQANVTTAGFTAFNDQRDALIADGVRIFGPNATAAQDVEPEYIAVTDDSRTAYVALQENNALAVVDIASGAVTDILPLGYKDHSVVPLDASDRDNAINITTYPNLFGLYLPDAISLYEAGGATYIVTANEGDAREYDTFAEEARVKDLVLDPVAFPNATALQADEALGRLTVTTTLGDANGDGLYEELYALGGRSFSIWDTQGNLVYDSGAEFEQTIAELFPTEFNADNSENGSFDSRSDAKGPEPEGVTIGEVNGRTYAFIGLERFGGVMTYDITNPTEAFFVDFVNNRDFGGNAEDGTAGDLGAEGLTFIPAADSPNGNPLVVVANEVSGSTTVFDASALEALAPDGSDPSDLFLDLRDLTGEVATTFTVNREAAFDNFVGFYRIADRNGGIDLNGDGIADVTPGQSGYTEAALANRARAVALTTANLTTSVFESTVAGGSLYAPFLIANGNLDRFNSDEVYFAFGSANTDGVEHIRMSEGAIGFEDLFGGGDNDFNDIVVKVAVSV
ncbi:choice-of-anchor I family protein [Phormidium tenue]|uniref:Bifunctional metallophosphatase/5'-nucleotidase n=1 Tax=Phormidium tenue NIES-30 TaxID=549789 RepID=A0A1U7JAL4_9CYAN|nr:choice-of-anchor I family protein [Phormidium tenue]MBD2230376.1 choice-of-anchor I family protein [Phormidium tenue FACHB-1052]OKH50824.1 bifunctional metallophosphatase/5'-nucleotidase [Phormidium tenue NIES-30]